MTVKPDLVRMDLAVKEIGKHVESYCAALEMGDDATAERQREAAHAAFDAYLDHQRAAIMNEETGNARR